MRIAAWFSRLLGADKPASDAPRVQPPAPSREDLFAAEVEAVLKRVPDITSIERVPEQFAFQIVRGDRPLTVSLGNVFAETRDVSPAERARRISFLVSSIPRPDDDDLDWEEGRQRLVPLLRTASVLGAIGYPGLDKGPMYRVCLPFLLEFVGIDMGQGIKYANSDWLKKWSVDRDALFATTRENAARVFSDEDVESYDERAAYPIWHIAKDDSYQSSRLLVPGWLAGFRDRVRGNPVAIVPHRGALIVGGDGDEGCLRRLVETARKEYEASPRSISPALYTLDANDAVVPLILPAGHPLASDVEMGHTLLAIAEYETQKEALRKKFGESVFVASFFATQSNVDGSTSSYSTWTRGAETLLPRTASIVLIADLGREPPDAFRVPWSAVEELAGEQLVEEAGMEPPRWRTVGFPDDAALAKLRAVAIS